MGGMKGLHAVHGSRFIVLRLFSHGACAPKGGGLKNWISRLKPPKAQIKKRGVSGGGGVKGVLSSARRAP